MVHLYVQSVPWAGGRLHHHPLEGYPGPFPYDLETAASWPLPVRQPVPDLPDFCSKQRGLPWGGEVAEGHDGYEARRFAGPAAGAGEVPADGAARHAGHTGRCWHDRLTAGKSWPAAVTVVVGPAGAGKSVLLSSWAAARPPRTTSWLSCDEADSGAARFWAGFIEAPRSISPGFGADAADLLAMDSTMSADVIASIANDAAKLPAGSAIIVDDFHSAAAAVARDMTDLVECWPAETAQLLLTSRSDPPLRLHRLRMSGELCELRNRDLFFSLAESHDLLENFGAEVADAELVLLHERSDGWAAALQMAALSLRGATDPARAARALEVRSHEIAEYFMSEVLDQQPPEVARFMLDISVLDELTAGACAAVTGRSDAAVLLRSTDAANLFLVALDDDRTSFRYHHLVRQLLRAELRARDRTREQALQLRAAEWFEAAGQDTAARPATSWRRGRPTGPSRSCRTGSSPTSCTIRRCPRRSTSARSTPRCSRVLRTGCWPWRLTCCCGVTGFAAGSTWTCSSAASRRSRRTPGWRPGSRRCGRCATR